MSLKRSPLFVLPLLAAASAASAADISPVVIAAPTVVPVVAGPQMLIQVEGGPVFSSTPIIEDSEDKFGTAVG